MTTNFACPKKAHWIMQRWPNVASSSGHFVLQGIPPAGESYSFHGGGLGAGGDRSSSVASTGSVRPPLPLPTMFSVRFATTAFLFKTKRLWLMRIQTTLGILKYINSSIPENSFFSIFDSIHQFIIFVYRFLEPLLLIPFLRELVEKCILIHFLQEPNVVAVLCKLLKGVIMQNINLGMRPKRLLHCTNTF